MHQPNPALTEPTHAPAPIKPTEAAKPTKPENPEKPASSRRTKPAATRRVLLAIIGIVGAVGVTLATNVPAALAEYFSKKGKARADEESAGISINNDGGGVVNVGHHNRNYQKTYVLPAPAKPPVYRLSAVVSYHDGEVIEKEENVRGSTTRTNGWGQSQHGTTIFDLPPGAFDVTFHADWNVGRYSNTCTARREGNRIIAEGTITSPMDGTHVWGELSLHVKYKIRQAKAPLLTANLEPMTLDGKEACWPMRMEFLETVSLVVTDANGKMLGQAALVAPKESAPPTMQSVSEISSLKCELSKTQLRVIRM
jgi:hypothetical protein